MANVKVSNLFPMGVAGTDQRLTVDSTAGGVQFSAFPAGTDYVMWDVQDAAIFVTFDASAPTTSNGHYLPAGTSGTWSIPLATAMKAIRATGTSGVIHATPLTD